MKTLLILVLAASLASAQTYNPFTKKLDFATGEKGDQGDPGTSGTNAICAWADNSSGSGFSLTTRKNWQACKVFAANITTPTNSDYDSDDWQWIKPISPAGAWEVGTTYAAGALVTYKRSTYRSYAAANVGNAPVENSAYWELVAGAGYDGVIRMVDTSSSTTAYTCTLSNQTAYWASGAIKATDIAPGAALMVVVNNANTGTTPTMNCSSLGAKTIVQSDGSAVLVGQVAAGVPHPAMWDGTYVRLQNPLIRTVVSVPVATCQGTDAFTGFALPASSPAVPACVTGTNSNYGVLGFANSGTTTAADQLNVPANILRADLSLELSTSATTGNYVPQGKYLCVAAGEDTDGSMTTFSSPPTVAANATANRPAYGTFTGVIPASCAGKSLQYQIFRDPSHTSDTAAATVNLKTLTWIFYSVK